MNDPESRRLPLSGAHSIRVTARDETLLLAEVLRHVFHARGDIPRATGTQSAQSPEGEVIGFRAHGRDLAALLDAAIAAAFNEADSQNMIVLDVEIGGVMSIPDGIRCWGYLTTAPRTDLPVRTLVAGSSRLVATGDRLYAEVTIAIEQA